MVVAKLLGHTSSRMVELVYGHLNDATHQAAIRLLPTAKHAPAAKREHRRRPESFLCGLVVTAPTICFRTASAPATVATAITTFTTSRQDAEEAAAGARALAH